MTRAEYDFLADVYDETRRPLDPETLAGISEALSSRGCRSVLEIAVGTGRVSVPLIGEGFSMTGVDLSRGMMERARAKGHGSLVQGDGMQAPFRDGAFDAVVLAHIIHLMDDPCALVREGNRVSRVGVFALLRKRGEGRVWFPFFGARDLAPGQEPSEALDEMRESFRRIAAKYGWTWGGSRPRNWGREREMLEACPPDELTTISDVAVTETVEDRIARVSKGAFSFTSTMPPEMREELAEEMRRRDTGPRERREVYQLAFWGSGGAKGSASAGPVTRK
jgi:SAM-dependent methyltransferase